MSTPGRSEIPAVLKRWADTRGEAGNELVELLQPVVTVADLSDSLPFDVRFPWHAQFTRPAVAAVFSALEILLLKADSRSWIEIEGVQNLGATADFAMRLSAAPAGEITANQLNVGASPRRLRGVTDIGGLGDLSMRSGTSPAALSGPHYRLVQGEIVKVPMAIGGGENAAEWAQFTIGHPTVNTTLDITVWGSLHVITAR